MRHIPWLLLLTLLAVGRPALAIQLHWAGGATDITVSQNTQAVLIVQADSAEVTLPNSWRLQWAADSLGVQFSAFDAYQACLTDTAKVDSIAPPTTPADSTANQLTAYFCSSGSNSAATAYYVADLTAGSHGKMKVVALNPADTTQVIQSNEVTFNGGIDGDYAPTIRATTYSHFDTQLLVHAVGSGLASVTSMALEAIDGSWMFPLTVTQRSDSSVTATATTVATMPECVLDVSLSRGRALQAPVTAEAVTLPMTPLYTVEMLDVDPDNYYPKDFAFVYTPGKFHCIYIRSNKWPNLPDSLNERSFGHRWTSDWTTWDQDPAPADTTVLSTLDGTWDDTHVWAPTIAQQGLEFYMFYTGVHDDPATGFRVQRMGLARSFDLSHWTRNGSVVDTIGAVPWADHSTQHEVQFRDPFVMKDPTRPSGWLMYFVASMGSRIPQMAVGVARSKADTLGGGWTNFPLPLVVSTDQTTYGAGKTESPHVFWDRGMWWMLFTTGSGHPISVARNAGVPVDTVAADSSHWYHMRLYNELIRAAESEADALLVDGWNATEYLAVGGRQFLGAYDGTGIRIQEMHWLGTTPDYFSLADPTAGVSHDAGMGLAGPALVYAGASPARGGARLTVAAARGERVSVGLYDLAGRRVRLLMDDVMRSERATLVWDGHDADGRPLPAGIYFARMSCQAGVRSLRIPLLR